MPSGFLGGGVVGPRPLARQTLPDPMPVAGAELLTNGNFASWVSDNPATWSLDGAENATNYVTQVAGAMRLVSDNSVAMLIYQAPMTAGSWYASQVEIASITGSGKILFGGSATFSRQFTIAGTVIATGRATSPVLYFGRAGACDFTANNITLKALTLASLLSTRLYASPDCDLSAAVTRTAGTQAGLVGRLDSATSPANFLIAYLDGGGNVKVDKCVAGVYTNVISGAVTYAAGRVLRLVCSGTTVTAYYNGALVGTAEVTNAGIVSNVRHGKFSTYASNSINNYTIA